MKKLFLLLAISSLGMTAAVAQTETNYAQNYWSQVDARQQVQAGSSDAHSGHAVPFNGNYSTLANPG